MIRGDLLDNFLLQAECPLTPCQSIESQFDPGEGPVADLSTDLVEAHPAAYDQFFDGLLILAHVHSELLKGCEAHGGFILLILGAGIRAVRQAVEAVVKLGARHLVLASRHFCYRADIRSSSKT